MSVCGREVRARIIAVIKHLEHGSIKNTLVHIDLEKICYPHGGDDYTGKVATTKKENQR